jgi:cell division protein FtsB
MDEPTALRRSTKGLGFPLIATALVLYFGYFAIYGNHGLVSSIRLNHEIELKQADLARIRAERAALERRVRLLRPESVDPDLLEEQARARLGLSGPNEVIILKDKR